MLDQVICKNAPPDCQKHEKGRLPARRCLAILSPVGYDVAFPDTGLLSITKMKELSKLVKIMATLRGPDGCPWDREQEPEDLKACVLEETYEVLDAIDRKDPLLLREELGDLLLQVVFLAQIGRERGEFTIQEVIEQITEKIVRRHPHVFGGDRMESSDEVLDQWERIKSRERQDAGSYLLDGVPPTLPALLKASRLASKAARVGFDWESADGALAKVKEEMGELQAARSTGHPEQMRQETGDLLFAVANLSRHLDVNAEEALQETNRRFTARFTHMEKCLREAGRQVSETDAEELEALWEEAKRLEKTADRGPDQK
jgi:MazG family protein